MREIKFRTFIAGKMCYWGFIDGGFMSPPASLGTAENMLNTPHMQFTGLLDKNRKEIYEGDVVFSEEYVGFKNLKAEVIFNRGRFCLNTGTIPEDLIPELCEIIGNVYETPNLLK